jgi:DNA repair exonuclease SbcCD ATPase subunit
MSKYLKNCLGKATKATINLLLLCNVLLINSCGDNPNNSPNSKEKEQTEEIESLKKENNRLMEKINQIIELFKNQKGIYEKQIELYEKSIKQNDQFIDEQIKRANKSNDEMLTKAFEWKREEEEKLHTLYEEKIQELTKQLSETTVKLEEGKLTAEEVTKVCRGYAEKIENMKNNHKDVLTVEEKNKQMGELLDEIKEKMDEWLKK